jgi:hypothetical protein
MEAEALRLLIRQKLQDGRLPHYRVIRFWARPGVGEVCDACESSIASDQMAVENFATRLGDTKPLQVHARCYQIWDAERCAPKT